MLACFLQTSNDIKQNLKDLDIDYLKVSLSTFHSILLECCLTSEFDMCEFLDCVDKKKFLGSNQQ